MIPFDRIMREICLPGYDHGPLLTNEEANPACCATVIIPARNEEGTIATTLDALSSQVDLDGCPLSSDTFEVLLLLNNCDDQSAKVAKEWKRANRRITLHVFERTFEKSAAHVGTARKLLMDTAWHRLERGNFEVRGILSTDSDTVVAPDWISRNMLALKQGADAVGGEIRLKPGDLDSLPQGARRAYLLDRQYQSLVAQLGSILDPQIGDPWPRHLENFGASLACTPAIYEKAGGMPAVTPLEDVAFVDALHKVGATLRHDPAVVVYTSSRLNGRAEIGLSHQLRTWQHMSEQGEVHRVPGAKWLKHRFCMLHDLRSCGTEEFYNEEWERVICDSFQGRRDQEIRQVNRGLASMIARLLEGKRFDRGTKNSNVAVQVMNSDSHNCGAREHPSGTPRGAAVRLNSTPAS